MTAAKYKIGKGRGTRTVLARRFTFAHDVDLAYWAGGVLHAERNGANQIRIHPKMRPESTDIPETIVVPYGYWIIKEEDGSISVLSPEEFATTARVAKNIERGTA